MQINWYPGHMAKAKRQLRDQLGRVDLVIELCDARLPHASRNPDLNQMIAGKTRILILNKADLADPAQTQAWINHFRQQGILAMTYVSTAGKTKQALDMIAKAAQPVVEKAAQKGVNKIVRAMVVGVPNVGKSTFTNRLHGGAIARTGDRPGVTRSNQWVKVGPYLELMDTPGLLWPRLDDARAAQRLAYIGTIRDEVVDQQMLSIRLLEDMMEVRPQAVMERFKVKDPEVRGVELLEAVCRGRGFLLKGGIADTDRGCSVVLDEFRAGKLGKLTLESPKDEIPAKPRLILRGAGGDEHGED